MLIYDNDLHKYTYNGVEVPSVTDLLPKKTFYCTPEQLEAAKQDGIERHSFLKAYHDGAGTLGNEFLIAYERFVNDNNLGRLVCHEKPLYSIKRFAGKPDAIYEKAIIDLKRTPDKRIDSLQLAGYSILARETFGLKVKKWLIVYFDGKEIKTINVYNQEAEGIFLSLVQRHYIDLNIKNYLHR